MARSRVAISAIAVCLQLSLSSVLVAGTFSAANNAEINLVKSRVQAARFLNRATFGPTAAEIDALATEIRQNGERRALENWIDNQFTITPELHRDFAKQKLIDDGFDPIQDGLNRLRYRDHAFWHHAIAGNDQLRQRVAWALIQIFVTSQNGSNFNNGTANDASGEPYWLGIVDYYDMLLNNAFNNYTDVLREVTLHPVMGVFLTHAQNRKPNPATGRFPDENYAREAMQLLSIGLYEMNQDGSFKKDSNGNLIDSYDNDDIRAFSRVFTGLTWAAAPGETQRFFGPRNYHAPMVMMENEHDTDEKVLLNGRVLPAGQTGMQDINDALENLINHRNTGPFVARLLIQRLVKSNPSKGYIRRVARAFARNSAGERGDMQNVIKAILLDREALRSHVFRRVRNPDGTRGLKVTARGTEHSRLREPVVRFAQLFRSFEAVTDHGTGMFMIPTYGADMAQGPYRSPSVFNFYLPDYQPPGDIIGYQASRGIPNGALFAPEFGILTAVTGTRFPNRLRSIIRNSQLRYSTDGLTGTTDLNFTAQEALAMDGPALLENLDLLLCNGTMSDESKAIIVDALDESTDPLTRTRGAIIAVMTSPACAVSY